MKRRTAIRCSSDACLDISVAAFLVAIAGPWLLGVLYPELRDAAIAISAVLVMVTGFGLVPALDPR